MMWAQLRARAYELAACAVIVALSAVTFPAAQGADPPSNRGAGRNAVSLNEGTSESQSADRDANPEARKKEADASGAKVELAMRAITEGIVAYAQNDWDLAIRCFSEAIRLLPDNPDPRRKRAAAYGRKGEIDKAIADMSEVIRLEPRDALSYFNRAFVLASEDEKERAAADYGQVIKLKPDDADAYRERGRCYFVMGNYAMADADFGKAIQLKPDDTDALSFRALSFANRREFDKAIADQTEAIRWRPEDARMRELRATYYARKGDFNNAIPDETEAIRLSPEDATMRCRRGIYYASQRDFDQAISDFEAAIRLKPDYADAIEKRKATIQLRGPGVGKKTAPAEVARQKPLMPNGNAGTPGSKPAVTNAKPEARKKGLELAGMTGERFRREHRKIVVTSPLKNDRVVTLRYTGKIIAQRQLDMRARVTGVLAELLVKEGQVMKKGDVLFKISPKVHQGKLDAEPANVRKEQNAAEKMSDGKDASQQKVTRLQDKSVEASVWMTLPEGELERSTARAPCNGVVDRPLKHSGDQVKEGDIITTLSGVGFVQFDIPGAHYLEYANFLKEIQVELMLANGNKFDQVGQICELEVDFDRDDGNVGLRAAFPNPDGKLQPGQAVTVLAHVALKDAVVVPKRTTFEDYGSRCAYVVGEDSVVRRHKVDIRFETDEFFVTKGLDAGEKLVLTWVAWIRDGDKIEYEFREPEEVLAGSQSCPEK